MPVECTDDPRLASITPRVTVFLDCTIQEGESTRIVGSQIGPSRTVSTVFGAANASDWPAAGPFHCLPGSDTWLSGQSRPGESAGGKRRFGPPSACCRILSRQATTLNYSAFVILRFSLNRLETRAECVTHLLGFHSTPSAQNGPIEFGVPKGIRTPVQPLWGATFSADVALL